MNAADQLFVAARDRFVTRILSLLGITRGRLPISTTIAVNDAVASYALDLLKAAQLPAPADPLLPVMSDAMIRHVFCEIANGRNNHGDFLKEFAAAMLRADPENFELLRQAARRLIAKYQLQTYLDTYEPTVPA